MKNYLLLYSGGLCGTWLTWLINQHANFPQYSKSNKNYINDKKEQTPIDIGCYGADYYIYNHLQADDNRIITEPGRSAKLVAEYNLSFEENRLVRPSHNFRGYNDSFTKDCIKVIPYHDLTIEGWLGIRKVNEELLKTIVDEVQPEKIILPIYNPLNDVLFKRWLMLQFLWKSGEDNNAALTYGKIPYSIVNSEKLEKWHLRHSNDQRWSWINQSKWIVENNPYGNNIHYVDIEKLLWDGDDEYLKLCGAINETPKDNIQEIITSYRNMLSEVAADFDRNYTFAAPLFYGNKET